MGQNTEIEAAKQGMHEAKQQAHHAATGHWMVQLARLGYIVNGVVYIIIGGLAAQLAFGHGGEATDQKGALKTIYAEPFGRIILAIVAVGLVGYALWSFVQAIFDTEGKGKDTKGIIARAGYAVTGISYTLLAFGAFQMVMGTGSGGNSSSTTTQSWTDQLLQQPFGVVLVLIIGVGVIGLACFFFYKAYSVNFRSHFNLAGLDPRLSKAAMTSGRLGYGALGVDFLIVGIFLIVAALHHDPHSAKGLDTALQTLLQQPFGPVLLTIVALGFIAYGVYSFVEARYRRIGREQ
jgi:hypothetical protein